MPCGLLPVGSRQVPRCLSASAHRQGDLRENQGLVMRECLQRGNVKKLDDAGVVGNQRFLAQVLHHAVEMGDTQSERIRDDFLRDG